MPEIPDDEPEDRDESSAPPPPSQTFSDMVRENPIGAVVGAFLAGMLVSRLL